MKISLAATVFLHPMFILRNLTYDFSVFEGLELKAKVWRSKTHKISRSEQIYPIIVCDLPYVNLWKIQYVKHPYKTLKMSQFV